MSVLELFGTVTSPYVRRVRIVAAELAIETTLIDTATESGQTALRQLTPLWKVPAARLRGQPLFDSAVIAHELLAHFGPGPLAPSDAADLELTNCVTVIDGVLDSLINVFYLTKEGANVPYIQKQRDRAAASLTWLDARINERGLTQGGGFGLPEIALVTAIEWMRFRQTYAVERHPAIMAAVAEHASRPSVQGTAPPT